MLLLGPLGVQGVRRPLLGLDDPQADFFPAAGANRDRSWW